MMFCTKCMTGVNMDRRQKRTRKAVKEEKKADKKETTKEEKKTLKVENHNLAQQVSPQA